VKKAEDQTHVEKAKATVPSGKPSKTAKLKKRAKGRK